MYLVNAVQKSGKIFQFYVAIKFNKYIENPDEFWLANAGVKRCFGMCGENAELNKKPPGTHRGTFHVISF